MFGTAVGVGATGCPSYLLGAASRGSGRLMGSTAPGDETRFVISMRFNVAGRYRVARVIGECSPDIDGLGGVPRAVFLFLSRTKLLPGFSHCAVLPALVPTRASRAGRKNEWGRMVLVPNS